MIFLINFLRGMLLNGFAIAAVIYCGGTFSNLGWSDVPFLILAIFVYHFFDYPLEYLNWTKYKLLR